jgi:hypothetical protein
MGRESTHLHKPGEIAKERMEADDIANVELVTICIVDGQNDRRHPHMQMNAGAELTDVKLTRTYRHGYNIHRRMNRQRVQTRPMFVSRTRPGVREGIITTSRRQLSTEHRMEIFAHTGVPALVYDISLPCGMRREALSIRNGLREGGDNVKYREAKVVQLQRDHDRVECRRQHHLKTQKEDRQQRSAKAKKKRRGGGVRAKLNEGSTIARNREHWANICGGKKQDNGAIKEARHRRSGSRNDDRG